MFKNSRATPRCGKTRTLVGQALTNKTRSTSDVMPIAAEVKESHLALVGSVAPVLAPEQGEVVDGRVGILFPFQFEVARRLCHQCDRARPRQYCGTDTAAG